MRRIPTDGIPEEPESRRRPRWVTALLILLPAWLVISGAVAVWYYFIHEEKEERENQARFARSVSEPMMADDLRKIVGLIGERNTSSEAAAANLSRTAAMIEGTLGPSNTGFAVRRERGPAGSPLLVVTLEGRSRTAPAVWIVTSYDSPPGSAGGEANASGLVATLAAAQAIANDQPAASIHFAFLPHANDPQAPVAETIAKFSGLAGPPETISAILVVEAMGAEDSLWLSSRDSAARPLELVEGLGDVYATDAVNPGGGTDLAGLLVEMNWPAVRVATRPVVSPGEADDEIPSAATVAASAGRLIELIRRCAAALE